MFGSNKQAKRNSDLDSLVGGQTKIHGDIHFTGGLHVDGEIKGKVIADSDNSMLTTSEQCRIEGDVHVHNIVLNGEVVGDVHSSEHIELAANARVTGNVYYKVIEMMMGAEVNGSMIHVLDGKNVTDEPAKTAVQGEESPTNGNPEITQELPSAGAAQ